MASRSYEIEAMLGLSELKQTKVYQEAKQEGLAEGQLRAKLSAIPRMIEFGLRKEQIAQLQDLPLEVVKLAAQSFHEQNVAAFIELLNNQRELFSPQDLADLAQLIEPKQDNIEELSQALAQWCKQQGHSRHQDALHQVLQVLSSATVEFPLETNADTVQTPDSAKCYWAEFLVGQFSLLNLRLHSKGIALASRAFFDGAHP